MVPYSPQLANVGAIFSHWHLGFSQNHESSGHQTQLKLPKKV
jgi:hypothetical protein